MRRWRSQAEGTAEVAAERGGGLCVQEGHSMGWRALLISPSVLLGPPGTWRIMHTPPPAGSAPLPCPCHTSNLSPESSLLVLRQNEYIVIAKQQPLPAQRSKGRCEVLSPSLSGGEPPGLAQWRLHA